MFSKDKIDDSVIFHHWPKKWQYYHKLIRDQVVGGPSIIFHRYAEAGKTRIKGGHLVQKIVGLDATSLYLYCLMQDMPVGLPIVYTCTTTELDPNIQACPAKDIAEADLNVDEYEWIEHEKIGKDKFYSDFKDLARTDPYLLESIKISKNYTRNSPDKVADEKLASQREQLEVERVS